MGRSKSSTRPRDVAPRLENPKSPNLRRCCDAALAVSFSLKPGQKRTVPFVTAAEGCGIFRQLRQGNKQAQRIEVRYGKLRLGSLLFELPERARPENVTVRIDGQGVSADYTATGAEIRITLKRPVLIEVDGVLDVAIRTAPK